jgi:hypothetical protein
MTAASQQRIDSGQQNLRLHRFDDVVVGPEFQAEHLVEIVVACREDENGIGVGRPQLPAYRESILARQSEIEDDEVRNVAPHVIDDAIAAGGGGHPEIVRREIIADQFG